MSDKKQGPYQSGKFVEHNKKVVEKIAKHTNVKDGVKELLTNAVKDGQAVIDDTSLTPEQKLTQLGLSGDALLAQFDSVAWPAITANTSHK